MKGTHQFQALVHCLAGPTWQEQNIFWILGQIQLNLILQELIVAHPSGSSGGASKESRTFSFWRFATESENWDFLDMSTIVKLNDYDCRLSENYPPSLFTDVQLFTNAITITCKSPPQQAHWKCNTSHDQLGLFWKSRSSSPLVRVAWKKLLVRNIWKLIKSLHQFLSICIALLLISGPCSWMSNSCCCILMDSLTFISCYE